RQSKYSASSPSTVIGLRSTTLNRGSLLCHSLSRRSHRCSNVSFDSRSTREITTLNDCFPSARTRVCRLLSTNSAGSFTLASLKRYSIRRLPRATIRLHISKTFGGQFSLTLRQNTIRVKWSHRSDVESMTPSLDVAAPIHRLHHLLFFRLGPVRERLAKRHRQQHQYPRRGQRD